MAVAVINETIDVPNVYQQDISRIIIGDNTRTALGKLRIDQITYKREWTISARHLTYNEYFDVINHLNNINYTATDFWLDEFGGTPGNNSTQAKIELIDDERVQFSRNGTWHSDGRNITLEVLEI